MPAETQGSANPTASKMDEVQAQFVKEIEAHGMRYAMDNISVWVRRMQEARLMDEFNLASMHRPPREVEIKALQLMMFESLCAGEGTDQGARMIQHARVQALGKLADGPVVAELK